MHRISKTLEKNMKEHNGKRMMFGKPYSEIRMKDWDFDFCFSVGAKGTAKDFIEGFFGNWLIIGDLGIGKTLFASVLANELKSKNKDVLYTTASRLLRDIRDSKQTEQEAMDKYIDTEFLIIDDLGVGRCGKYEKDIISEIVRDRYSANVQTLAISEYDLKTLRKKVFDEMAFYRLVEGVVTKVSY